MVLTSPDQLLVFDVSRAKPKQLTTLKKLGNANFGAVAFSPQGQTLATACADGSIRRWDLAAASSRELPMLKGLREAALAIAFAPDGRTFAAVSNTSLLLWDLTEAKPRPRVAALANPGHDFFNPRWGTSGSLAFSPDSATLATAGNRLVLWEVASGKKLREWQFPGPVLRVAFSADGYLACGNDNGTVYILRAGKVADR